LQNNCQETSWYFRRPEDLQHLLKYRINPRYLTSVEFDISRLRLTSSLKEVVSNSDILVLAIPSAFVHEALAGLSPADFKNKVIFSAVKGIIPEYNLIPGEYLNQVFDIPLEKIGVITGPCHAEEVAMEKLSYLTLACTDPAHANTLSGMLGCRYLRTVISDDIYGTEYAAVIKNIIAIAGGICHGLGYGDNFFAVLISNAIQEIKRFVDAVHPIERDIKSSAYLGDLLVTAYSQFSRNRMFGAMLGKGYSVKQAQLEMNMVAEGYYAVKCVYEINRRYGVQMPICTAVYNIIHHNKSASREIAALTELLT
jgi:glycerol-3-phosphate dehydrogenase (NAD(P)+)